MSGGTSGDVSLINDEDLLRKMWQDTEDFGRKKEIRAHMYKLREARLRDFYNSGEVNTDIQRSTTKTTESKSCSASTHADSLADHSFISMKTKEIRDSESPTRDASYRVIDKGLANQGWTVVSSNKKSDDGKTFTTSKIATTSGSEKIDGGKLDYAAKNEQQASVYRDGDDKNFTKSVGASSSSVIKQEAAGGDENSSFRSSATKTSSSSKYATEHRSTSGDVVESQPPRMIAQNQNDEYLVSRKTYTDNIPSELKNHPNFVEGKTKVTRETRTLPDGTTVTTTRYEVKGGTTSQSSKNSQYSSSTQQRSSESRTNQNESKSTRYISEPSSTTSTTVTRHVYDDLQPATTRTVTRTVKDHQVDSRDGASRSTVIYDSRNEPRDDAKTTNKTTVVRTVYDTREQPTHDSTVTSTTRVVKNTFDTNVNACNTSDAKSAIVKTTVVKNIYDVKDRPVDDSRTSTVTKTIVTKQVDDFRPQVVDDSRTSTTTKTTVTKQVDDFRPQVVDDSRTTTTKTTVIKHVDDFRPQVVDDSTTSTTSKTTVIKHVDNLRDEKRQVEQHTTDRVNRHEANEKFITIEQEDTTNRMVTKAPEQVRVVTREKQPKPVEQPEKKSDIPDRRPKPDEKYELPERRQPIKPGKSELSDKPKPTEGQYETTYRTEFTNKRISVDVSPTHDAFARSLRAVSPDRISKCSSPSRSLRTSTNSLRSSTSPEKNRHPSRLSPERRSTSPRKATSHETITKTRTNTDRITRKHNTTEIDSSTLTRRKNKPRTRSRSPSPTSIASDIEFIRNTDIVTDLDTNETTVVTKSRPASLEITRRTTKRVTDRSPTSPLTDTSPKKSSPREVPRTGSLRNISPTKDVSPKSDRPFKRTDTYEERCRQILGISNQTEQRKNSLERVTTKKTTTKTTPEKSSPNKEISSPTRKSPEKKMSEPVQRRSPTKVAPKVDEFPSQVRRSPDKQSVTRSPDRKSPVKDTAKINEFPSQVRRVPEKEPLGQYPEKKSPVKEGPKISEFPSQVRKSPEKEPSRQYPEKKSPVKEGPKISEFPSQIRKVPQKQDLEPYPEKKIPTREGPSIDEFPSQIRKPSEKEPLEPYPERKSPLKEGPKICEFPSQIRKSPEKEPLEPYPEKKVPTKEGPKVSEFPSQIRRSPEKEVLEPYPEKKMPIKDGPKISEFPSQIKRVPEKEPLEAYPEKTRPEKEGPKVSEFPSQIRKLPEREPLEQYPEKKTPMKGVPRIGEKKSPEDEPFEQICEFPSQVRKPYEKEPLEPYPEKRSPAKEGPKVSEFPSQIRKSTEKEPLEPYPEKKLPVKDGPKVSEFPSQVRKQPEREPLEPFPEKKAPVKEGPKVSEFPSQIRRSPEKEPLEPYPERKTPAKEGPKVSEFPSQIRRSPEKESLEPYPERKVPQRESPQINEFPSQIRKSPEKEPSQQLPERTVIDKEPLREYPSGKYPSKIPKYGEHDESPERIRPKTYTCKLTPSNVEDEEEPFTKQPQKEKPKLNEFPSQVSKSPEKKPTDKKSPEKAPEKVRPKKDSSKTDEFPSQIKKVPEKETPDKNKINRGSPKTQKEPSPIKKVPGKLEQPGKIRPTSPIKKPKKRTDSTSSSETDEENEEVEEIQTVTRISELEGRVPVDEPLATKKFISQLCRDDEIQRTDLSRKETQTTLNREVMETGTRTQTKTVKKDSPRKPQELFIENERKDSNVTINKYSSPRATSPMKKPLTEKNTINTTGRTTNTTTTTVTSKTDSKTARRVTDEKTKLKDVKKTAQKITLYDIENMNENKEDNRVHIRTHRIDDTINKKVVKSTVNGDVSKKAPTTRRPQPIKPEEPKTRKPIEKRPQKVVSKTVTETETRRTITEQKTPKRHVVTTTITVNPTTRTSPTKSPTKTPTTKTTSAPKPSKVITKKPKLQNGNVSSDEESIVDSLDGELTQEISTTFKKGKITRTTSDQVVKKKTESKTPVRGTSKPELLPSKTKQEKCITTKSIIINNETNEREVIVDLQRSKSSREPTPDRICPLPVSSDDESTPRYPDQIAEPDDSSLKRKPKKLSDIPILEGQDVTEFSRITEIEDTSSVNLVDETDISLLSVDKKINKFLDTTGKIRKPKQGPAPKVERPKLEVSEDLESDECLLSVSEKVNKFINTAEQLTTPQDLPQRPKSPKCQYYPDDEVSVSDKVAHFITTAEKVVTSQKEPAQKVKRPNFDDVDENIKRDECLLSVSDKVSKFINTSDRLTSDSRQSVSLSKMDTKQEEFYRKVPSKETTPTRKPSGQYSSVKTEVQEEKYPRRGSSPKLTDSSPRSARRPAEEETTPIRRPSNQYSSIRTEVHEEKYGRRDSSPKLADSTPKSTKRPTEDEPKRVLSPSSRLRSTESVKKAKALFENINKDQQVLKQRDILSRPSVFEGRKINKTETVRKLDYENEEDHKVLKSTKLLLEKAQSRPRSPDKSHDVISRRSQSPDGDVPGYMRPLDRSLRPNSPHRDNISQINQSSKKYTTVKNEEATDVRQTKFGVSLRRTDSGRVVSTSAPSGRSRVSPEEVTEADIEEIYDMEILELLLEKIIDYEVRRKIRTQIRLVKKLITEDKLEEVIRRTTVRDTSPAKVVKQSRETTERTTEYHSSYAYNERRSSSEYTKVVRRSPSPDVRRSYVTRRSQSPEMKPSRVGRRSQTPEMKPSRMGRRSQSPETRSTRAPKRSQSPESKPVRSTRTSQSPETKPSHVTRRSQSPELRGKSPEKSSKITKLFQTQLKKTSPSSKTTVEDNTPEWVKQRNLKKVANTSVTTTKSSTTTTSKKSRSSPVKEAKPTDIITSSYGVGPTDENGSPLFGLKALRARNKTDTTKVQGTVIRSQYYSENGQEPVGEISVTKYSTDPRDLGRNEDTKSKGVTSITTTQKFGYKDTPSLKNLTNSKKKKEICEAIEDETETRTTKVTRRGSVKALSQKFIENAVETSKSERQSSYPKAGLILRTSSFKDSGSSGDSREGSTERTVTMKTSTRTVAGETFLTNRSKVTGVQDVISRMKSEDVREGDTAEDIEARGLLNKFLGAQVILSGIESNVKASSTTTNSKRITKVTTTITEGGKPVTKTRTFQHPVSEEELESVWDEQTLRLLLEQSTDYEERRQIRARLRQVMAEQEACTELVEKASQDQIGTTFEGATHVKKTFTEGPVTTSQVTRVTTTQQVQSKKPMSPFAKFRQLDKQNSLNSPRTSN